MAPQIRVAPPVAGAGIGPEWSSHERFIIITEVSIAAPARKRLLVAALLCAFVCAYAAPVVSHFHQDFSQHCCWLCQVGPSPFLQPAASALL
ncbi:MAG TPA: hypothetical protein VN673_18115, partial [Clostridia bacterium]|nr:hypothetical protein [Clostridia bacterium]